MRRLFPEADGMDGALPGLGDEQKPCIRTPRRCLQHVCESGVGRREEESRAGGVRTWQGFEKFHFWTLHVFVSKMRNNDDLRTGPKVSNAVSRVARTCAKRQRTYVVAAKR